MNHSSSIDGICLPLCSLPTTARRAGPCLYAIQNSGYLDFVRQVKTETEAHDVLARGEVEFVVNIPENFSRDLLRGDKPSILVEADATDPAVTSNASARCAAC